MADSERVIKRLPLLEKKIENDDLHIVTMKMFPMWALALPVSALCLGVGAAFLSMAYWGY